MKKITVLTQSYHQPDLLEILINSFEANKTDDVEVTYIVVEGSSDKSYADRIKKLSPNVRWFNNEEADVNNPIDGASIANGRNLEFGKKFVETDWVFVCHNDVAVTSKNFFNTFLNLHKDYELISMCRDNTRINACHISGLFVKNDLLQKVDCMPNMPALDVGDRLTEHCIENNLKFLSLPNTHNDSSILSNVTGLWRELGENCGVDRCIVNNEVIFVHLGRGTPKSLNSYHKNGKITYKDWLEIHKNWIKK